MASSPRHSGGDDQRNRSPECGEPRRPIDFARGRTMTFDRWIFALAGAIALPAQAQWIPQQSGTNAEFRGLVATSNSVIWASGTRGRVAHTTDGGATWTVDSIPGASSLDLRAIAPRNDRLAWAISAGPAEQGQA